MVMLAPVAEGPFYNVAVPHVIESAPSGRAKCRACLEPLAKGEQRFGERQPNAFGEGEMTLWFHLRCAAYTRPAAFLEASSDSQSLELAPLIATARFGIEHRRVPRLYGAERATTGRAHCRHCKELIAKGSWRIAIVFFEDYRFSPGGFVHLGCARDYFETGEVLDRIAHFSPDLQPAELAEIAALLRPGTALREEA